MFCGAFLRYNSKSFMIIIVHTCMTLSDGVCLLMGHRVSFLLFVLLFALIYRFSSFMTISITLRRELGNTIIMHEGKKVTGSGESISSSSVSVAAGVYLNLDHYVIRVRSYVAR